MLIAAFATADVAGSDGGKLKIKRQTHNAAVATSADPAAIREALGRTIIFDQVDDAELQARCAERLRRDHGVPSDRTTAVLLELRAAIDEAKSKKTDAFPLLRRILARASPPPIRPHDYIARGNEADLVDALSRDNVLLLSGRPGSARPMRRVGSRQSSCRSVTTCRSSPMSTRRSASCSNRERRRDSRFSMIPSGFADFGPGGTVAGAPRQSNRSHPPATQAPRRARARTAPGDRPHNIARSDRDGTSALARHGRSRTDLPGQLVRSLASTFAVESALRDRVADALSAGALVLEPGCLEHLAANTHRLRASASIAEVTRLAREDAAQLGRTLSATGWKTSPLACRLQPRRRSRSA
ncbi:hypothetical protein [Azospirillum argentinense]|uniref:hypothetical protein n=1 Tax=Azospirillum argentinense TaxID=2970906 RepID=UPI0010C141F1|nr:hypothetical protein [Azospirillum argentinense]